jgi:hypothetical protein
MTSANPWKALLLAYPRIDVRVGRGWFGGKRFIHELPEAELQDALHSFRAFPALAGELSNGEATVTAEIAIVEEPLRTVTSTGGQQFWPSPDDTRKELNRYAPAGQFDSLFVFWPNTNLQSGANVPCAGWGLGSGPRDGTYGATYAVVGNAQSRAWEIPIVGEVWLHEWLHGVCRIFAEKGYAMPEYDADGGGSHGYVQSPTTGWTSFYRDLMTGQVLEDDERKGITIEAWRGREANTR